MSSNALKQGYPSIVTTPKKPTEGWDALSVLQYIARLNSIQQLTLFKHDVAINWRQKHSNNDKARHLDYTCFGHNDSKSCDEIQVNADELATIHITDLLQKSGANQVFSVGSAVKADGKDYHIPMMNFHPEVGGKKLVLDCLRAIRTIRPDLVPEGVVLSSGRYYHYYGFNLIETKDFPVFLSYFLMPAVLVSPRYIGHALYEEQCSLRITKDSKYKTRTPTVVTTIK